MTTDGILRRLRAFRDARGWQQHHTPRNLAAALAVEASELQELFLWSRDDEQDALSEARRRELSEEVADVLIYALNICDVLEFDPLEIVDRKITLNEQRFPAP